MKSVTRVFSDVDSISGKETEYNIQLYEQLEIQRQEKTLRMALILKNASLAADLLDGIRISATPFLSETTRAKHKNSMESIYKLIFAPENTIKTPSGMAKRNYNNNMALINIKELWESIRIALQSERGMFHKKKDFNPARAMQKGL